MQSPPRSPPKRLSRTSSYSRPGSAEFQKASRSRSLSRKISRMTASKLDEKYQALLNEVTNRSDMKSYFLKGKMLIDEDLQTDNIEAEFDDMNDMVQALRDVYFLYNFNRN